MLERYAPVTIVMIGIAAAVHDDLCLMDVVVARQVDRYLATGAAVARSEGGQDRGGFEFELGGEVYRASFDLVKRIQSLEFAAPAAFRMWRDLCTSDAKAELAPDELEYLHRGRFVRSEPQIAAAHMATGPIVGKAQAFSEWLRHKRDREIKALDMESGGLMKAAQKRIMQSKTVILRGISDFGDERKQELDMVGGGAIRRLACRNAVRLLWTLFEIGALPPGNLAPG